MSYVYAYFIIGMIGVLGTEFLLSMLRQLSEEDFDKLEGADVVMMVLEDYEKDRKYYVPTIIFGWLPHLMKAMTGRML
jgi:hypothetical protein